MNHVAIENLATTVRHGTKSPCHNNDDNASASSYETVDVIECPSEYETVEEEVVVSDYITDDDSNDDDDDDSDPPRNKKKNSRNTGDNKPSSDKPSNKASSSSPKKKPQDKKKKKIKVKADDGKNGKEDPDDSDSNTSQSGNDDDDDDDGVWHAPSSNNDHAIDTHANEKPVERYQWKPSNYYHGNTDCFHAWKQFKQSTNDKKDKRQTERAKLRRERREMVSKRVKTKDRTLEKIRRKKKQGNQTVSRQGGKGSKRGRGRGAFGSREK